MKRRAVVGEDDQPARSPSEDAARDTSPGRSLQGRDGSRGCRGSRNCGGGFIRRQPQTPGAHHAEGPPCPGAYVQSLEEFRSIVRSLHRPLGRGRRRTMGPGWAGTPGILGKGGTSATLRSPPLSFLRRVRWNGAMASAGARAGGRASSRACCQARAPAGTATGVALIERSPEDRLPWG